MNLGHERFFLDTNIFVYSFDKNSKSKQERAKTLVSRALDTRRGIVSFQVVQEFLNVATRKFSTPLSATDTQLYLMQVMAPLCEVFPNIGLYSEALSISRETGFSFYDSLILASAIAGHCETLLTEDLQDGQRIRGVKVHNPFR